MPKRKNVRVLQFVLPFPLYQPEPCDDDRGPEDPHPRRRNVALVDIDSQADCGEALWKEAA